MLQIKVDTTNLSQTLAKLHLLTERNINYMTAKAMTRSGYAAQQTLRTSMDRYIHGGPTRFTYNSTFVRIARPNNLAVEVGYRQEANKGTAAGRYLNPMTVGGTRPYKSTERQMQRVGLLRSGEYLMPTGVHPLTLNSHGNLSGPVYMRVLSRIKGLHEMGFTANVSPSRRSQRKRAQSDFFITTGEPRRGEKMHRGIYARVGPRPKGTGGKGSARGGRPVTSNLPRGFHTVFYITRPPVYRPTFPVPSILNQAYERAWGEQLQRSYQEELAKAGFAK